MAVLEVQQVVGGRWQRDGDLAQLAPAALAEAVTAS